MFNKTYNVAATERANKELANSFVKYTIKLLDDSTEMFNLSTQALGMNMLDSVCDSLELLERDYFGIQYKYDDQKDGSVLYWKWMKMDKLIRKQVKGDIGTITFHFRVRFVPQDIYQLQETYTRYQLFLQIKQDIHSNKINCSKEIAVQLSGYALQSELGDYNSSVLKQGYVGEFRFIHEQTPSFEAEVANFHKTLRGIRPEEAELKFLTTAKQLHHYGCDMYKCELMEKAIQFGFHAIGISIFPSEPQGPFVISWNALDSVFNRNKCFMIKVLLSQPIFSLVDGGTSFSIQAAKKANLTMYDYVKSGFKLLFPTNAEAKEVWKTCIENHSFFRVRDPKQIQGHTLTKHSRSLFKLANVRSLFTGRRTLPEILEIKRRNRTIERSFIRTPSKRYARKHTGQFEKQSVNNIPESHRQAGNGQGKNTKQAGANMPLKDKIKTDTKKEEEHSESEHSEIEMDHNEPGQFRSKSLVTQSVRLDKNNNSKGLSNMPTAHSTIPRKLRNVYSKSLSMDDDRKGSDTHRNEAVLKNTNNDKSVVIQRPSSTIIKSQSKPKLPGPKSSASNCTESQNQSSNKQLDVDSCIEISLRPQDGKYGFTLRGGNDTQSPVIVTKVSLGSAADISVPNLFEGDEIIKINNRLTEELTNEEIKEIIRSNGQKKDNQLVLTVKSRLYIADDSTISDYMSAEEEDTFLSAVLRVVRNDIRMEIKLLDESLKNGTAVAQFEKLYKQKHGLMMNEAKKNDNIAKNRYKDILPYDQTRIIIGNGDYINANLIKFDMPKGSTSLKYIATQGPLLQTVNDFFTMVWENRTQLIVMLTDLQENGRSKCFKYWPDSEEITKLVNGLQISCESETLHSTYVIREMRIRNVNESRKFTQLQYIGWPDRGVPQRMEDFIAFIKTMRQIRTNISEPILVHCSAGIGRTGVVITMDIAIAYIELKKSFSVLSIVREIRNQRAMLIQSQKQYDFVCRAIVNYFSSNSK